MTLADFLAGLADLGTCRTRLGSHKRRFLSVDTSAADLIDRAINDPSDSGRAYRLLGSERHDEDRRQIARTKREGLKPRFDIALYEAESRHMRLQREYLEVLEDSKRAPSTEQAFLRMTGSVGNSADRMLLLSIAEQTTIANLRAELPTAPPSRRLRMYREALQSSPDAPVNNVTIRALETWDVPYPQDVASTSESEIAAATALGRLKQETQLARVPAELVEAAKVLSDAAAEIRSARNAGAHPINPAHRPDAAKAAEEAEALDGDVEV